jgi:hypothetical protein
MMAAQCASFLGLIAVLEPRRAAMVGAHVEELLKAQQAEQVCAPPTPSADRSIIDDPIRL